MGNYSTVLGFLFDSPLVKTEQPVLWRYTDSGYQEITYRMLVSYICELSLGLRALGIEAGDRVALLSNNRPEWVVSDLSILALQAINVPIYPTLTASEISVILADSGARAIIVETEDHLNKVLSVRADLPDLEFVIYMGKVLPATAEDVLFYHVIQSRGQSFPETRMLALEHSFADIDPDSIASIVYTSGTTGKPKGVCLTHRNITSNVMGILSVISVDQSDRVCSFLPLSHVFERTAGYYTMIAAGGQIFYAESIETVSRDILAVKPTILISVPRLYQKIQAKLFAARGVKQWIFQWALALGKRRVLAEKMGDVLDGTFKWQYRLAERLVFGKIREKMGGSLRFFVSGGAPLGAELGAFFEALGLRILEGYGMTETSPVISCNHEKDYHFSSVGYVLPGVFVKLDDDGELLVKGDSVMKGYWQNPEATAEIFSGDYLRTGDIAKMDDDGRIYIVDRKKELIVLCNGKKVPPQVVEQKVLTSRYVSQIVVTGENRHYLTALVYPNLDAVLALPWLGERAKLPLSTWANDDDVLAFFNGIIKEKLSDMAAFEQVKRCALFDKELTQESGELTPSLKVKRRVIYERYSTLIDQLYQER